jgi:hypothetical protein
MQPPPTQTPGTQTPPTSQPRRIACAKSRWGAALKSRWTWLVAIAAGVLVCALLLSGVL